MSIAIGNGNAAPRNIVTPQNQTHTSAPAAQPKQRVQTSVAYVNPDNDLKTEIRNRFARKFGKLAADKKGFHAFTKKIFGKNYDTGRAEKMRRAAVAGDYSWLPEIRFVDRATLQGANGAYAKSEGKIYIAGDLRNNPVLAAQTFTEEAGHHIDAKINTKDTPGDEGEMFRRVLSGERLSKAEVASIRSENDHGELNIDGKNVKVEFFFKKLRKSFRRITRSVSRGFRKVVGGVGRVVKNVARGVGRVAGKVIHTVTGVFKKVTGGIGKVLANVTRGAFSIFKRAISFPKRIFSGLKNVVSRVFDTFRSVASKIWNIQKSILSKMFNIPISLAGKLFRGLSGAARFLTKPFGLLGRLGGMVGMERGLFGGFAGAIFNPMRNVARFALGLLGRVF